jgi:predicted site-specific integrase-resolvase
MNPAHAFNSALGLFQELKPEIGMPCVAAAQATQTTNTDINSGLAERRNALYRLFRHLNDRKVCSILMH